MGLPGWIPSLEQLTSWGQVVKTWSITALTAGAAIIGAIGLYRTLTSDAIVIEPIRVPSAFEQRGFTAEIATARLLDEVAAFERQQSSAKDRVSILSRERADELVNLQAVSVKGLDTQTVQGVVREALGIVPRRITGDVTLAGADDEPAYRVRLRRQPENRVIVDLTTSGDPQAVLRRTAIALIEAVDPMIAASIHWRARDEENAMRMVDEVLANDTPDDDKYGLNLRGYVHITNGRHRQALDDFAAIMRIDPSFAPAHFMASWAFREQGDVDRARDEAQRCIDLAPGKSWGYLAMARVHLARGEVDDAAAMFLATVERRPDALPPYVQASGFLLERGRADDAGRVARAGLRVFPESAVLHATLGDALSRSGDAFQAGRAYRRALQLDGTNARAKEGLAALAGGGR